MNRKELLQIAKPILFNTEMVEAIMDGRKTVTRRVIKPQPEMPLCYTFAGSGAGTWVYPGKDAGEHWGDKYKRPDYLILEGHTWTPPCHAEDILYVRETWCKGRIDFGEEPDGREVPYISQCPGEDDYIHKEYAISHDIGTEDVTWKPSIHMPKEAARIFLEVKRVSVERLQEMTEKEARKEGVYYGPLFKGGVFEVTALSSFPQLWNSTIKKQDIHNYEWDANPWVWVIEFERIEVDHE